MGAILNLKEIIEQRMTDNLEAEEKFPKGLFGAAAKEDLDILAIIDEYGPREQVDLKKEIQDTCRQYWVNGHVSQMMDANDVESIAKHFFELGQKSVM